MSAEVGPSIQRRAATSSAPEGSLWWDTTIGVMCVKVGTAWEATAPIVQSGTFDNLQPEPDRRSVILRFPKAFSEPPAFTVSSYISGGGTPTWANPSISSTTATHGVFFYASEWMWSSPSAVYSWTAVGLPAL